jgi:hypothetical protein
MQSVHPILLLMKCGKHELLSGKAAQAFKPGGHSGGGCDLECVTGEEGKYGESKDSLG